MQSDFIVVLLVNESILTLDGMVLGKFTSVHPIPLPAELTRLVILWF